MDHGTDNIGKQISERMRDERGRDRINTGGGAAGAAMGMSPSPQGADAQVNQGQANCGSASREMTGSEILDLRSRELFDRAHSLRHQADNLETEGEEMRSLAAALPTGQGSGVRRAIMRLLNTRYGL